MTFGRHGLDGYRFWPVSASSWSAREGSVGLSPSLRPVALSPEAVAASAAARSRRARRTARYIRPQRIANKRYGATNIVRMLAFIAPDRRLASSVPEVRAPFHIGHCARTDTGNKSNGPRAIASDRATVREGMDFITGSLVRSDRLCQIRMNQRVAASYFCVFGWLDYANPCAGPDWSGPLFFKPGHLSPAQGVGYGTQDHR